MRCSYIVWIRLESDPCTSGQNDCSKNATCTSDKGSYTCQCKNGFSDLSPNKHYPGRDCRTLVPDTPYNCGGGSDGASNAKQKKPCLEGEPCESKITQLPSSDNSGGLVCSCPPGSHRSPDGAYCICIIVFA